MTEQERAEELAKRLGTEIPDSISMGLWPLPLLEILVDRLEALEKRVWKLDDRYELGR